MNNWLERAKREIPPVTDLGTAKTAIRASTSVMAVAEAGKVGIAESSIGSNGSVSTAGLSVIGSVSNGSRLLTETDVALLRTWLTSVGESDLAVVDGLLNRCGVDDAAREYFLSHALGAPKQVGLEDDRRVCNDCANLKGRVCSIAYPGGLVSANRGYRPIRDVLHRCAAYKQSAVGTDVSLERIL